VWTTEAKGSTEVGVFSPVFSLRALSFSLCPYSHLLSPFSSPVDLDSVTFAGNTALHWAARNGHLDVVNALLDGGARLLKLTLLSAT
jgi:hypothetical protein